jgi:YD repeat-containing protein
VVVSPFGPVKVKTLPVLASKVLVSECPRALVVLTGNLPSPSITRTSSFTYNSDGLLKSETIAPNTNKSLTTTYEYDSFGNKTKSTVTGSGIVSRSTTVEHSTDGKFAVKSIKVGDFRRGSTCCCGHLVDNPCVALVGISFPRIVSRSTTVEHSTDGKFPVKTTNALGHSETKTFDAKTGNVLTLTGPNGLTTTHQTLCAVL